MFRVVNPMAYIHDSQSSGTTLETINFDNWRTIGALGLATGTIEGGPTGGLAVDARYFDVANRSLVGGRRLMGAASDGSRSIGPAARPSGPSGHSRAPPSSVSATAHRMPRVWQCAQTSSVRCGGGRAERGCHQY